MQEARDSGYEKVASEAAKFSNENGDVFKRKVEALDWDSMLYAEKIPNNLWQFAPAGAGLA